MSLLDAIDAANAPPIPNEDSSYGWRPMPLLPFFDGLQVCRDTLGPGRHTFLDVGSGIGSKLAYADALGFEPTGIEIHQPYVEESQRMFPRFEVIHADARHYTGFWRHNIVFIYNPMRGHEARTALLQHIQQRMQPGSLLFSPARDIQPASAEHLGYDVWRI